MNKQELIKQITDKVAESVPGLFYSICSAHIDKEKDCNHCRIGRFRYITLEDLICYLDKEAVYYGVSTREEILQVLDIWRLCRPLHEQSDECLEFIWSILK